MVIDRSKDESQVSKIIRMNHHSEHNLNPMEECENRDCRLHTGRTPYQNGYTRSN